MKIDTLWTVVPSENKNQQQVKSPEGAIGVVRKQRNQDVAESKRTSNQSRALRGQSETDGEKRRKRNQDVAGTKGDDI